LASVPSVEGLSEPPPQPARMAVRARVARMGPTRVIYKV
jgi:hypothetical protein